MTGVGREWADLYKRLKTVFPILKKKIFFPKNLHKWPEGPFPVSWASCPPCVELFGLVAELSRNWHCQSRARAGRAE